MYDVSELRPNGKEIAIAIIVVTVLLVVIFCAGYMLGLRNAGSTGKDVLDKETELLRLEANLQKLKQLSTTQKTESKRLKEQLTILEQELQTLKNQLATSSTQLTQAQKSLQTANQLLTQYAQEAKQERLRIKAQRNGWIAATVLACIGLAIK